MSSQESSDNRSTITQESSNSEAEIENLPQIQGKSKRTDKAFQCWKFTYTIQADVVEGEFKERKRQVIEHFRTRTTAKRPTSLRYFTTFADLYDFVNASPGEIRTVSIAITGYVQTSKSRPVTMANWIPSVTWTPLSHQSQEACAVAVDFKR